VLLFGNEHRWLNVGSATAWFNRATECASISSEAAGGFTPRSTTKSAVKCG